MLRRYTSFISTFLVLLITVIGVSAPTSAEEPPVKYGIALDIGGVGDNSYNDAVMSSVVRFKKKYQIPDSYVRAVITDGSYLDRVARLRFFAKAGYSMIIAIGPEYNRAVSKVANEYPNTTFAIVNSNGVAQLNVSCLTFNESQAAFLAGIAAGATSKSGSVGFVGTPATVDAYPLFTQGVLFANPKVKTSALIFDGTKSAAIQFLSNTNSSSKLIDVLYSTWSVDSEILDAVKSMNSKNRKVWLITETPDQYFSLLPSERRNILATVNKRVDLAISDVLELGRNRESILDIVSETNGIYGRMYSVANSGLALKFLSPVTSATQAAILRGIVAIKRGEVSTQG